MGVRGAFWTLLLVSAALSCGGRFLERDSGGNDGATDGAGARDAASGRSGAGGSGPSNGGQPQAAGTTAMAGASCACPLIGCSAGYVPVPPAPGECCSSECRLDCTDVGCSDIDLDCREGFHVGTLPDECCPRCLPDVPVSCVMATVQYGLLRNDLLAKYQSQGCDGTIAGCSLFQELNRCAVRCGTPIPRQARDLIEEELHNFAYDYCTDCPQPEQPNCPEPGAFSCQADASCQFDSIGAK